MWLSANDLGQEILLDVTNPNFRQLHQNSRVWYRLEVTRRGMEGGESQEKTVADR